MPYYTVIPFVAMLFTIAIAPLIAEHFWERNRNKALFSLLFMIPVVAYEISHGQFQELVHTGEEYLSFIILLGALFVVSGAVTVEGDIRGTPLNNLILFIIGAILANFIGTTGASMILIRPLLKINSQRERTYHIPVFFIFIVSNVGGCLTPLGDPPIFLGYLQGVPFFWTLQLFPVWLTTLSLLLMVFYVYDTRQYRRETRVAIERDDREITPISISGKRNFWMLGGIIGAVFLPSPQRELVMVAMGMISMQITPPICRQKNNFSFAPINEVAILFVGIFFTMIPAIHLLREHGAAFGITQPWQFFWITGGLSSVLDNAPTYLSNVSLAQGLTMAGNGALPQEVIGIPNVFLRAISAGAVFMGALTYIGNGPNLMVKAISESNGYKMPSFFGYLFYSALILLPILLLDTILFFR